MFYDGACTFTKYIVNDLKDYISNKLFATRYNDKALDDYNEEIDQLRADLLATYESEGQDATIEMIEEAPAIACEKIKVFKADNALSVLEFMANYK